jgi:protease secretion system outer membrane protein
VVGTEVTGLDHLRAGFHVTPADTKGYEEWKRVALDNNPDLQALTKGIEISRQEINKARSGHVPRLDVVGTYGKLASDTINTYNQDQVIRSIGFQLNVPLYNGGAVSAQTRQAQASHEKAKADLETQMDKTLVELRKNYNQVASSVPRNEALEKAVESARLLVTATEQSIKGGVRINLDLLNAKRQLVTAQRDLAQARYGYIMAALRLRAAAGVLSADDVKLMAAYFE